MSKGRAVRGCRGNQGVLRGWGRGGSEAGGVCFSKRRGRGAVPTRVLSVLSKSASRMSAWGHGIVGCLRKAGRCGSQSSAAEKQWGLAPAGRIWIKLGKLREAV